MNAWPDEYKEYGVVSIEKTSVKVFCNNWQNIEINVGESVSDANWAGNSIIVRLENGQVRKYLNNWHYITH